MKPLKKKENKKMNQQIFIATSFKHRKILFPILQVIEQVVVEHGQKPVIFANEYQIKSDNYKSMMDRAFQEICSSSCLIVELSHQVIGVGIEMGIARAKNIPIIIIQRKNLKISTTSKGIAKDYILYSNAGDLYKRLKKLFKDIES